MELMRLHVDALFRATTDGRLIETNETPPEPAPRVFVGRTGQGVVLRVRQDVPRSLASELEGMMDRVPLLPERAGEVGAYAAIEAELAKHGTIVSHQHGPVYAFAQPPLEPDPAVVEIGDDRSALVGPFAHYRQGLEHAVPFLAVIRDGAVVAACYCARRTAEAAEAGVDTNPEYRRRGFARAVVNAWRIAVEASGRTPLYSTSFDNAASRAIARGLGMSQYGETFSLS